MPINHWIVFTVRHASSSLFSEMASRWLSALSKWHKITVQPKPLFSTLHFDCISSLSTLWCYREAFLREKRHFVFHSHLKGHHWKGEKRDQLRLGLDADFHLCNHKVTEMRMLQSVYHLMVVCGGETPSVNVQDEPFVYRCETDINTSMYLASSSLCGVGLQSSNTFFWGRPFFLT